MYLEDYHDDPHSNFVCRMHKALYGLKQAPRAWLDKIGEYLITIGFQFFNAKFSLYVKRIDKGIGLVVIYVDDLIITSDNDTNINEVKLLLK